MNKDGLCEEFVHPEPTIDDYLNPPTDPATGDPTDVQGSTLKLTIFTFMMTLVNLMF